MVLIASSLLFAGFGLACLFLPATVGAGLGLPGGAARALPLAAPAPLGIAAMNAVGRGAVYGGIYGRPLVLANFLAAGITTLVLLSLQFETLTPLGALFTAAFAACWLAFAVLMFRHPHGMSRDTDGPPPSPDP